MVVPNRCASWPITSSAAAAKRFLYIMAKLRLDQLLVDRGLVPSRSKAQALIMARQVFSNTQALTKPGQQVQDDIPIEIKGQDHPWVSRGGLKLAHALEHFALDVTGLQALDIGASTGGFTDVLLHHGADHVTAVDVGHGQLAWKLRQDDRVTVLEKTNARHLTSSQITTAPQIITCDASFISLTKVLPASMALTASPAWLVALIKPQFEVGKDEVGKGGVVRASALHERVCAEIRDWFSAHHPDWHCLGITESPITGPEGNKEFLIGLKKG